MVQVQTGPVRSIQTALQSAAEWRNCVFVSLNNRILFKGTVQSCEDRVVDPTLSCTYNLCRRPLLGFCTVCQRFRYFADENQFYKRQHGDAVVRTVVWAGDVSTVHLAQLQLTCRRLLLQVMHLRMTFTRPGCELTFVVLNLNGGNTFCPDFPLQCWEKTVSLSVESWDQTLATRRQILACIRLNLSTVSVCLLAVGPNHADPGLMVYKINEWRMIWTGASLF